MIAIIAAATFVDGTVGSGGCAAFGVVGGGVVVGIKCQRGS